MAGPDASTPRRFSDGVSLHELVRYLREGVYIMDADGVVLDANPVALDLLGVRRPDDVPRTPVRDRLRPADQWRAEMQALADSGAMREFTREIERPDGSVRTLLDTCYARVDDGVVTYHGIVVDISVTDARDPGAVGDAHARDEETGAYTADYLDALDVQFAARQDAALGVCVVHMDTDGAPVDGEHALERMTRFLLRHIRATEAVARAAHDQLVVVLPDADERATEIVGRRLQLAALRSAPSTFRLGWAARRGGEAVHALVGRALRDAVPVRVVERHFQPSRRP